MRTSVLTTAAAVAFGLVACSNDTSTYKDETETFIEDTDGEMAEAQDKVFTNAECDEPESTEVGTMYTCTATDEEGTTYVFDAEIDSENSFIVQTGVPQER
ncbi:MAG: hypothetical protein ACR2LO_06250 [Ilumatobacteraceae bacterium]